MNEHSFHVSQQFTSIAPLPRLFGLGQSKDIPVRRIGVVVDGQAQWTRTRNISPVYLALAWLTGIQIKRGKFEERSRNAALDANSFVYRNSHRGDSVRALPLSETPRVA